MKLIEVTVSGLPLQRPLEVPMTENHVVWKRFLSGMRSVEGSTDKVVAYRKLVAELDGQCSPYVSHRRIKFLSFPDTPFECLGDHAVLVANTKHCMFMGRFPSVLPPLPCGLRTQKGAYPEPVWKTFRMMVRKTDSGVWIAPDSWFWSRFRVPLVQVESVLRLARELFKARTNEWAEDGMIEVCMAMPRPVGWTKEGKPVFRSVDLPVEQEPQTATVTT